MASLLAQTIVAQTPLTQFVPWIALLVTGFLLYEVFIKKDSKYIEALTTQRVLVPLFILVALALAPASVTALFGFAETAVTVLIQLISAVLISVTVVAGLTYMGKFFGLI